MKAGPQLYLRCEWCHGFFKHNGGKRKRWCTDAHKQAQWRSTGTLKATAEILDSPVEPKAVISFGTHECVAGFIYGELNKDGVCMSCGQTAV